MNIENLEIFRDNKKNQIIIISLIVIIGFIIRVSITNFELPLLLDAEEYFWYANDLTILGFLPNDSISNNGWPVFLSIFFGIIHSNNVLDYMFLQRIIGIILSSLTIIIIYYLSKRFFSEKIAYIGAIIYAIEPRIIQNSVQGLTEPFDIFLISCAFLLYFYKRYQYLSIILIGISTIVRSESIFLFIGLLILTIIQEKRNKRTLYKLIIFSLIFFLTISPMLILRVETNGNDGVFYRISSGVDVINYESKDLELIERIFYFLDAGINHLKFFGWILIPIFILFVPITFFKIFQENYKIYRNIFLVFIIYQFPIFYAYLRTFQETKYFLPIYPILIILSLYAINYIIQKKNSRIQVYFLIIIGLVFSTVIFSIYYYENTAMEVEILEIAKYITKNEMKVNALEPISNYLTITNLLRMENFPILRSEMIPTTSIILIDNKTSWENYIDSAIESGATHIITDNNEKNLGFILELYHDEKKFSYLEKVYDSNDMNFNYKLKIYKIDFEIYQHIINQEIKDN